MLGHLDQWRLCGWSSSTLSLSGRELQNIAAGCNLPKNLESCQSHCMLEGMLSGRAKPLSCTGSWQLSSHQHPDQEVNRDPFSLIWSSPVYLFNLCLPITGKMIPESICTLQDHYPGYNPLLQPWMTCQWNTFPLQNRTQFRGHAGRYHYLIYHTVAHTVRGSVRREMTSQETGAALWSSSVADMRCYFGR